jgi:hypothetical protein
MAEPSTTTLTAAAGIGFASLFPGIDGNALIGAFTGAALVVVTSKDLSLATRFAYLLISLIVGYLAAPDVVSHTPITSTGVAAFFAAALAITVTLQLIERVKTFDFTKLINRG